MLNSIPKNSVGLFRMLHSSFLLEYAFSRGLWLLSFVTLSVLYMNCLMIVCVYRGEGRTPCCLGNVCRAHPTLEPGARSETRRPSDGESFGYIHHYRGFKGMSQLYIGTCKT